MDKRKNPPQVKSTVRLVVRTEICRENIIFIGSEEHYDSFWWKMMFVASGFAVADRGLLLRAADRTTVACVNVGYSRSERLALEQLKDSGKCQLVFLRSFDDLETCVNNRRRTSDAMFKVQDMAFFSHGLPGRIALNYQGSPDIDLSEDNLSQLHADVFVEDGRIYSYACRTGTSEWDESFADDNGAHPERSLAQRMADHFGVEVRAFLTRTDYGGVLREESQSESIINTLNAARDTQDGNIIQIPPDHEALPHPGLGNWWWSGPRREGAGEYALWRKLGAIGLPVSHATPEGLTHGLRDFSPGGGSPGRSGSGSK